MRRLFKLALAAVTIAVASPAFAQGMESPIIVERPYARATPAGAVTGAVYMILNNKADVADRLTAVSSDVADKLQLHEMAVVGGVMQMRQLANGLSIPAGGSVVLKPGGYHVMLIGLKSPLRAGETFPLTLTFEKAGNISVTVPVQAMDAAKDDKSGGGMGSGGMGSGGMGSGGMGNMEMK